MLLNFLAGCTLCCIGIKYIDAFPKPEQTWNDKTGAATVVVSCMPELDMSA